MYGLTPFRQGLVNKTISTHVDDNVRYKWSGDIDYHTFKGMLTYTFQNALVSCCLTGRIAIEQSGSPITFRVFIPHNLHCGSSQGLNFETRH